MSETTSACVCTNESMLNKTLTLVHNFNDGTTTMMFTGESDIVSLSIANDSSIIKQALEEALINL